MFNLYSLNGNKGENNQGEATGKGTLEDPYNSWAAIQICRGLGSNETTNDAVYVKGKVSNIKENYNGGHGNGTFYISEDGTSKGQFYIFRALYLGNVEYTEGTLPAVGDDVIIYGKLTNYQGNTPETVQKEAYLYSLNGDTGEVGPVGPTEGTGDGSANSPYDVEAAQSLYNNSGGKATNAYVTGYVIGYVDGNKMDETTVKYYSIPEKAQTEILIADNPQEFDYTKCIPVQLKKDTDFQTFLDIYSNQGILGTKIVVYGSIEKYFGVCGIKSISWASYPDPTGNHTIGEFPGSKKRTTRRR